MKTLDKELGKLWLYLEDGETEENKKKEPDKKEAEEETYYRKSLKNRLPEMVKWSDEKKKSTLDDLNDELEVIEDKLKDCEGDEKYKFIKIRNEIKREIEICKKISDNVAQTQVRTNLLNRNQKLANMNGTDQTIELKKINRELQIVKDRLSKTEGDQKEKLMEIESEIEEEIRGIKYGFNEKSNKPKGVITKIKDKIVADKNNVVKLKDKVIGKVSEIRNEIKEKK